MCLFRFLPFFGLALSLASPLRAETPSQIPNPLKANRSWVADSAEVLSAEDERRINAVLSPLQRANGAEVAVATVHNLGGQSVEDFAQELFQLWKPGISGRDNGALILVAVDDRKSRIHIGYGLEEIITDGQAGEISRSRMTPAFKRGAYGEGIYSGVLAVAQKIDPATKAAPPAATGETETLPPDVVNSNRRQNPAIPPPSRQRDIPVQRQPSNSDGDDIGGIIGIVFVLFGLVFMLLPFLVIGGIIWFVVARLRRPPTCPRCKTPMVLLPETLEDASLSEVQQFEEKIGSRDYRVWQCPQCHAESISAHDITFSAYSACPKCRHRTAHMTRRTLKRATERRQGIEETTINCEWRRCGYSNSYQRPTPRLSPQGGAIDLGTGMVIGSILGGMGSGPSSGNSSWGGSSNDSSGSSGPSFDSGPSDFGGGDSGGGGASDSW
jgi:uncharacterized protein